MNLITSNQTVAMTMTSREIAELTGKEHRNVVRDIRVMLVQLYREGGVLSFEHTYISPQNGQSYPGFNLPKRETLILVSGYDVSMRAKIIDRWQELEGQVAKPQTPSCIEDQAANSLSAFLRVGVMLKVPEHIVQVEGVKDAKLRYGIDFSPLLLSAPAQNDIKFEDEMLEPTELGKRLGYGAAKMNLILCSFGLQSKVDGEWVPTEKGAGLSFHHQWHKGSKSGYNYKWRVAAIEDMLREEEAA